jgi:YgiT-type zinc finger domain-containing protein
MKCVFCKVGETALGTTEVVLRRDGATLVVREVPADVCDSCGEAYLSEEVSTRLDELTEDAFLRGVEVQIMRWPVRDSTGKKTPESKAAGTRAARTRAKVARR